MGTVSKGPMARASRYDGRGGVCSKATVFAPPAGVSLSTGVFETARSAVGHDQRDLVRDLERGLVPARKGLARVVGLELRERVPVFARSGAVEPDRLRVERGLEVDVEGVGARGKRTVRGHADAAVRGSAACLTATLPAGSRQRHRRDHRSVGVEGEARRRARHLQLDVHGAGVLGLRRDRGPAARTRRSARRRGRAGRYRPGPRPARARSRRGRRATGRMERGRTMGLLRTAPTYRRRQGRRFRAPGSTDKRRRRAAPHPRCASRRHHGRRAPAPPRRLGRWSRTTTSRRSAPGSRPPGDVGPAPSTPAARSCCPASSTRTTTCRRPSPATCRAVQEAPLFRWLTELYEVWRGDGRGRGGRGGARRPGRAAAHRLHHHHRPPLPVPARAGAADRRRDRGRARPGHPLPAHARLHEPRAQPGRAAARRRGAGRGDDPRRLAPADPRVPRPAAAAR